MEYVPEHLRQKYDRDRERDWMLWLDINAEIAEKYCCKSYLFSSYEELVYSMEYPTGEDTEAFQAAKYNENGYVPILLSGVIIENKLDEDGDRLLQLVSKNEESKYDAKKLLHLRNCASAYYTVLAWNLYSNRTEYTIGDLQQVRPGTKVIIAATHLTVSSGNNKWVSVQFTDVAPDLDSDYIFVDKNYRIHQSEREYLTIYDALAKEKKNQKRASTNSTGASGGCYIATAVYNSYDCPEVWTLRRYRDSVLALTWYGRLFIKTYYRISPTIVKWFGDTGWFTSIWKKILDPIVKKLQDAGFESTRYIDM